MFAATRQEVERHTQGDFDVDFDVIGQELCHLIFRISVSWQAYERKGEVGARSSIYRRQVCD